MTLQASGAISLANVQTEFGGSNPIGINEYYGVAAGVPASGTISLNNFYGKSAPAAYTWTGFSMGYRYGSVGTNQDYYTGPTITPGSGGSPVTFAIYSNTLSPGYLQLYVGGTLNATFNAGTFSYPVTFGGSSLYFISYLVMDTNSSSQTIVSVGAVDVLWHFASYYVNYD